MKILIDIGHPAHVHYFKNFIWIMQCNGHEICITARDKDIIHYLLQTYSLHFFSRGKGSKGLLGKLLYLLKGDINVIKIAKTFNPDIFLSFGSTYAAHASFLLRKPHIAFDDTEHAQIEHLLYVPFTKCILTSSSFKKDFGEKQIRYDGTIDNAYLHENYHKPDMEFINQIGLFGKDYSVVRFIDWNATHDLGQSGFSEEGKTKLIDLLLSYGEVIISCEGNIPNRFRELAFKYDPTKMHTLLQFAKLFVGESGTMATEAAVLGTTSVMLNSSAKYFGVYEYITKYGNLFHFDNEKDAYERTISLLKQNINKEITKQKASLYFEESIDLTAFMVWFIGNYPESFKIVKKNPDYQYNFR